MARWQSYELDKAQGKRLGLKDRLVVVRVSKAKQVFGDDALDDEALRAELEAAVAADASLADRFDVALARLQPREQAPDPVAAPTSSPPQPGARASAETNRPACPSCAAALEPDTRFCLECGTPACSACGVACDKDARFCIACGAKR